ncbi:MAG: cell wall-binding repeat-containing protein [Bacteroidota bacterium]
MPLLTVDSPNTTRVFGRGPYQTNVAASQLVFGRRSNAVILASSEQPLDALAALSLVHQPIDGPVLLSSPDGLDPVIQDEVRRLAPMGAEGLAQAIIVGALGDIVEQQIASLGLSVMRLAGMNAYHTAAEIARFLGYPRDFMLLSGEHPLSGLCAGAMAVHAGVPILFTLKDSLPQETAAAIRASGTAANLFIVGNRNLVSDAVETAVRSLTSGTVGRISADDPFELAVKFAKYRSADGTFGFSKTEKQGHAFTFVNPGRWQDAISGALLAHTGKHTPILFCRRDDLPTIVRDFLLRLNPAQGKPQPPFMHAFIVGDFDAVSASVQLDIDDTISVDRKADHEVVHTVAPGDSLLQIARRYGVPIRDIAGANQLSTGTGLTPGSRLLIPYTVTSVPPAPPTQELH